MLNKPSLGIEDTLFSRARLGKYWTEAQARECLAWFPTPYAFNAHVERKFINDHRTDYNDNLLTRLSHAE